MKATGQIRCYRQWGGDENYDHHFTVAHGGDYLATCDCPRTSRCEWIGGAVASVTGNLLSYARREPNNEFRQISKDVYQIGPFRVRLIDREIRDGMAFDTWLVMRDGVVARFVKAYRRIARRLLEQSVRAEVFVRSFTNPVQEGEYLQFTGGLAKILL